MVRDDKLGWRLLAATGALAMVATACGGGDGGTDTEEPATEEEGGEEAAPDGANYCEEGGDSVVRWAHEQEPADMHLDDPNNNLSITSWIQQGILEGLYGVTATNEFVPELLAEEAEVTENDDGTVTYSFVLRDDVQFNDGEPITGQTVQDNWDIIVGEGFAHSTKTDYERILEDSWEVDGQEFSFATEGFFAGYPTLFVRLYPSHLMTDDGGENNEILANFEVDGEPLPASGPFQLSEWNRGVSMSLTRNDDYHGANNDANEEVVNEGVACASGLEISFVTDTDAQINALRAGEADFIFTQPQVQFGEGIAEDDQFTLASEPGPVFEHWSLNTANPHLADANVREALAYAMDKGLVMEALYAPLFGDILPTNGLGNAYWMSNSQYYEDHQGDAGYGTGDHESATQLLEESGYELNGDDVWEHPERGTLSLRVSTTGGNQLRELQQQQLQADLNGNGWDVSIDNAPGADHFGEQVFSPGATACSISGGDEGANVTLSSGDEATADCGIFDISQFAWVGGPWPGSTNIAFRSESENNPHVYANEDLDALMDECDGTIDDEERAACYNEADRYVTTREIDDDGLVIIPITQKPSFYAYSNNTLLRGAVGTDANDAGPLVYSVDFLPAG